MLHANEGEAEMGGSEWFCLLKPSASVKPHCQRRVWLVCFFVCLLVGSSGAEGCVRPIKGKCSKCFPEFPHGWAAPASRCELTFRSSETPALGLVWFGLVGFSFNASFSSPNSVLAMYRADFGHGLGSRSKCPYHQSSITNHRARAMTRRCGPFRY
jgi:hypothetical protein